MGLPAGDRRDGGPQRLARPGFHGRLRRLRAGRRRGLERDRLDRLTRGERAVLLAGVGRGQRRHPERARASSWGRGNAGRRHQGQPGRRGNGNPGRCRGHHRRHPGSRRHDGRARHRGQPGLGDAIRDRVGGSSSASTLNPPAPSSRGTSCGDNLDGIVLGPGNHRSTIVGNTVLGDRSVATDRSTASGPWWERARTCSPTTWPSGNATDVRDEGLVAEGMTPTSNQWVRTTCVVDLPAGLICDPPPVDGSGGPEPTRGRSGRSRSDDEQLGHHDEREHPPHRGEAARASSTSAHHRRARTPRRCS